MLRARLNRADYCRSHLRKRRPQAGRAAPLAGAREGSDYGAHGPGRRGTLLWPPGLEGGLGFAPADRTRSGARPPGERMTFLDLPAGAWIFVDANSTEF